MRKSRILVFTLLLCVSLVALFQFPVYAATTSDDIVETSILGNIKDDGKGCGVYMIVNLVLYVLTAGIGVIGMAGIIMAGVQYATAGDNDQQLVAAKGRIRNIVIGLALWVFLWAIISWLLPGGAMSSKTCSTVSDTELAELKAQEEASKASPVGNTTSTKKKEKSDKKEDKPKGDATCLKKAAKVVKEAGICEEKTAAERIAKTAELLAWSQGTSKSKYKDRNSNSKKITSWSQVTKGYPTDNFKSAFDEVYPNHFLKDENWRGQKQSNGNGPIIGASCNTFAAVVLKASGNPSSRNGRHTRLKSTVNNSEYYTKVSSPKRGDVCYKPSNSHWSIVIGKNTTAEAGNGSNYFGRVLTGNMSGCTYYRVKEK